VWFAKEEGQQMATRLGLSESDFLRDYARKIGSKWSLKEVTGPADLHRGHDCILLDRQSVPGKRCARSIKTVQISAKHGLFGIKI
jgi:hypothetical protein